MYFVAHHAGDGDLFCPFNVQPLIVSTAEGTGKSL